MKLPSTSLKGKVAVVTGGGGGLGTLAACTFGAAGADVVIVGKTAAKCEKTAEQVRALGGRALAIEANVTSAGDVSRMVELTLNEFGTIDVLFNNAGVNSPKALEESSEAEWFRVIEVNVKGTFLVTKAILPVMKARRSGKIINMASVTSRVGLANRTAYSASKAAIAQITRSLALEMGPHGINVNAIGPAVIVTDLNRDLIKTQPALYDGMLKRMAMGRFGEPRDLSGPLIFLASQASDFVTGQVLYVDGGYTAG